MVINLLISVFLLFGLPAEAGKFKRAKSGNDLASLSKAVWGVAVLEMEQADYVAANGERFTVEIARLRQDGEAYQVLSFVAAQSRTKEVPNEIGNAPGTAGFISPGQVAFFKGSHVVSIRSVKPGANSANMNALAQALSEKLDKGEGDIPPLIKHLPNPDEAQKNAVYLNSIDTLQDFGLQIPVLNAVRADGNADAALATLDAGKVLLIEYHTPQLATENDQRIIARIQELWKISQPAPSAYRRVGNYSVFVFDARDEQTAKQLIDQVKYEQVVSWLGENPHILREAQERYVNTTLGVLVAVVKASGYALVACLGIGGLIGALLFSYRRSQQKSVTAYSDAGGMLRLNLDELTTDLTDRRK